MDALKGTMSAMAPAPSGGVEQNESLQNLMRAKSGRSLSTSSTPRASALGSASAAAQVTDAAKQQASTGAVAAEQVTQAQDQQAVENKAATQQVDDARLDTDQKFADQAASMMQEFKQAGATLDLERDAAKVEQLGFLTRLGSEQYVNQLETEGARARLDDKLAFDLALAHDIFDDEIEVLGQKLNFADMINQDENKWREQLARIDLDTAMAVAAIDAKSANTQAVYTGVGGMVSAGAQGAEKIANKDKPPQ